MCLIDTITQRISPINNMYPQVTCGATSVGRQEAASDEGSDTVATSPVGVLLLVM